MDPSGIDTELLLVNLGTPAAPSAAAVREFLSEFLADPMVVELPRWIWLPLLRGIVLRRRPERVAELYRSIWTREGSPLAVSTERIVQSVARALGERAHVTAAYRYGRPGLAERVSAAAERARRVVVAPLFPQRTASSSGTVERLVEKLRIERGLGGRIALARLEPDDAGYVAALAARYEETVRALESPEHVVFSFHGIPAAVDRRAGGTYRADCERTAAALLERLSIDPARATLCFQSRFGPARWLEPATDRVLAALPARGLRRVAVLTPGFLTDTLESLEEIGVRGRATFARAGGAELALAPSPAGHPALAASLAALVR